MEIIEQHRHTFAGCHRRTLAGKELSIVWEENPGDQESLQRSLHLKCECVCNGAENTNITLLNNGKG
jgi:hypothetical protein